MKKNVFVLLGFSSLMVLSCRQQEEIMDSEDLKSLKVLENIQSRESNKIDLKLIQDSVSIKKKDRLFDNMSMEGTIKSLDGEGARPPR